MAAGREGCGTGKEVTAGDPEAGVQHSTQNAS